MKERASNSTLQNQILLYMENGKFKSLTELAGKLKVHRSSVSRAIHALLDRGLVSKINKNWNLTAEGKSELSVLRDQISERAAKTTKTATRVIEQGTFAALSLKQPLTSDDMTTLANIKANAFMLSSVQQLADSVAALDSLSLVKNSVQPMLDAASNINVTSAVHEALRHLEEQNQAHKSYLHMLPTTLLKDDYALLAREMIRPLMDAVERFDAAALIPESLKQLDPASYLQGAISSITDLSVMDNLKSSLFESSMDAIMTAALRPSVTEIMAKQAWSVIDAPNQPVLLDLYSQLSKESLTSLTQSQHLNLASIEQISLIGKEAFPLLEELNATNVGLSQMIYNLSDIHMRDFSSDALMFNAATQFSDVAAVTRTYKGYLADTLGNFAKDRIYSPWDREIALPTRTTAAYISSVNISLIQVDADEESLPNTDSYTSLERLNHFDPLFKALGPNFIAMWHGSWSTLQRNGSDHIRQAAHSGRELLMQFLAYYAPDSCFSDAEIQQSGNKGNVTRKMRVRKILQGSGNSTVKWVDAIANALDETYAKLAATSHYREVYPDMTVHQLAELLYVLGGMIAFIEGSRPRQQ